MTRPNFALRAGVSLAAIMTAATPVLAQSALPPADAPAAPAAAGDPGNSTDIVVTGSRIRRDPLSQDAPIIFVDQDDIAKTGLNSINDVLQRLPSSGGGLG